MVERGGASVWVGRRGLQIGKKVFAAWPALQEGRSTRTQRQADLDRVANHLNKLRGAGWLRGADKPVVTLCQHLLEWPVALWTFPRVAGVEPTNNFRERWRCRAVGWRRRSFGGVSAVGCRFVERILTVVPTRRLQDPSVLNYLHDALRAHRAGQPGPALLATE